MQAQDLTPGEWVLIRRRIVTGKGQNKEAARWIGPGRVLSIESAKEKEADDRFGHLVHVSYNGRLWGCAPEQLRLLHPAAKAARASAEEDEELKKLLSKVDKVQGYDIRAEAPLPDEDVEPPPEDIPAEGLHLPRSAGEPEGVSIQDQLEGPPPPPVSGGSDGKNIPSDRCSNQRVEASPEPPAGAPHTQEADADEPFVGKNAEKLGKNVVKRDNDLLHRVARKYHVRQI